MERSGFKKIYFAPIKNNVYSSWIEIPDAEELTPSLLGGTEPRYCGDKIAGVKETYKGEQLTIKTASIPESFKTTCMNYIKTSSGSLIKVENKDKAWFALGYVEVVDGVDKIKVYPNCRAGLVVENSKTESQTPDYQTTDLPIIASTVNIGGKNTTCEENIPYSEDFFKTAYTLPTIPAES